MDHARAPGSRRLLRRRTAVLHHATSRSVRILATTAPHLSAATRDGYKLKHGITWRRARRFKVLVHPHKSTSTTAVANR
jgi:hypothetical protein